jgi:hypothetical protein
VSAQSKAFDKALTALAHPAALLVRQHGNGARAARFEVWLPHKSFCVSDAIAEALLMRPDFQPYDSGLFPGCPQSWKRERKPGDWRDWRKWEQ